MRKLGRIPKNYDSFNASGDLAEFIGVVLGDGNISKFPRTERLIISANSNNRGFIQRYAKLARKFFRKEPTLMKARDKNNVRISVFQNAISKRLGIPTGDRSAARIMIPSWVWSRKHFVRRLIRGLFEAEGSISIHRPTYTYNLQFSNKNPSLLKITKKGLKYLGYHPEIRPTSVRLRKKQEVEKFMESVRFRKY